MSNEVSVDKIELGEVISGNGNGTSILGENLEVIQSVKVSLEVVLGNAEMTVKDLFGLKNDAIVKLDRDVSSPVDITLNGKVIAKGELVAVEDNFGIRIVEISKW